MESEFKKGDKVRIFPRHPTDGDIRHGVIVSDIRYGQYGEYVMVETNEKDECQPVGINFLELE